MEATNTTYTKEQRVAMLQDMQNKLAEYGRKLERMAKENQFKFVVTGWSETPTGRVRHSYVGNGNGWEGCPLAAADCHAVIFSSRHEAGLKARELNVQRFANGADNVIVVEPYMADYYFLELLNEHNKGMAVLAQAIKEAEQQEA